MLQLCFLNSVLVLVLEHNLSITAVRCTARGWSRCRCGAGAGAESELAQWNFILAVMVLLEMDDASSNFRRTQAKSKCFILK